MEDTLQKYLMEQLERRKMAGSAENQDALATERAGEAQSNASNALGAALMKSASMFGSIGGKTPDAGPAGDMAQALSQSNRQFYGGLEKGREDEESRFQGNAKLMQYLADRQAKQNSASAAADYRGSRRKKASLSLHKKE
jgi:hypothetical protein